jgi:hypothetical protein
VCDEVTKDGIMRKSSSLGTLAIYIRLNCFIENPTMVKET